MLNILPTWSWALAAIVWVTLYLKSLIYENNKTSLTGLSDAFCFSIGIPYGFGLLLEGFRINPILFLAQSILVSLFWLVYAWQNFELMFDGQVSVIGHLRKDISIRRCRYSDLENSFFSNERIRDLQARNAPVTLNGLLLNK